MDSTEMMKPHDDLQRLTFDDEQLAWLEASIAAAEPPRDQGPDGAVRELSPDLDVN